LQSAIPHHHGLYLQLYKAWQFGAKKYMLYSCTCTAVDHEYLVLALIAILFKGKGKNPNVYNSSRPIWMLIFVLKVLEMCFKLKYGRYMEKYLPESQFLFRGGYGCEDLILILSLTRNRLLDLKIAAMFLFNDYKNAFQDISQPGMEDGLWDCNMPQKGIAIFRLMHACSKGVVRLRTAA
jgi:hypothetical protein